MLLNAAIPWERTSRRRSRYALASASATKDVALPQAERDRLAERQAARAIELLGKAKAAMAVRIVVCICPSYGFSGAFRNSAGVNARRVNRAVRTAPLK